MFRTGNLGSFWNVCPHSALLFVEEYKYFIWISLVAIKHEHRPGIWGPVMSEFFQSAQVGQHMAIGVTLIPAQCKDGRCNHQGCLKMKQRLNGGHVWLSPSHDQTSFLQSRVTVLALALIMSYQGYCSHRSWASSPPVSSSCLYPPLSIQSSWLCHCSV